MANTTLFEPFAVGWEPMPSPRPRVRRCPACRSVPIWRHNLNCYWIVCETCGLSGAAFKNVNDAVAAWNIGSEESDRVQALRESTVLSDDDLVDAVMQRGQQK